MRCRRISFVTYLGQEGEQWGWLAVWLAALVKPEMKEEKEKKQKKGVREICKYLKCSNFFAARAMCRTNEGMHSRTVYASLLFFHLRTIEEWDSRTKQM